MPSKKETHYFSRHLHDWPLTYYSSLFAEGEAKVRGEITPGYNILRAERIQFIRRIMPDVRLVLIIRNPIERSWSEARRSMGKVAKSAGIGLDEVQDSEFYVYFGKEWMYVPEYGGAFEPGLLQGKYSRVLDNWLSVFPQSQLKVCFFDQIGRDPEGLLREICEHIGVNPDIDWEPRALHSVVNKNPEHSMPGKFRRTLEERYCDEIEELYRRFGKSVEAWRCQGPDGNSSG